MTQLTTPLCLLALSALGGCILPVSDGGWGYHDAVSGPALARGGDPSMRSRLESWIGGDVHDFMAELRRNGTWPSVQRRPDGSYLVETMWRSTAYDNYFHHVFAAPNGVIDDYAWTDVDGEWWRFADDQAYHQEQNYWDDDDYYYYGY